MSFDVGKIVIKSSINIRMVANGTMLCIILLPVMVLLFSLCIRKFYVIL